MFLRDDNHVVTMLAPASPTVRGHHPSPSPPVFEVDGRLSSPTPEVSDALAGLDGPVLVLGAGGKMGLHLCAMLRRADQATARARPVTAVSRFSSLHGRASFEEAGVETLACDLEDETALAELPDAPNIIFMAGAKFGTGNQPDLLHRMNVELPRRVARRFAGHRCLVFSTGCVYSMVSPSTGGSKETDPTDPPGDYAKSCLGREMAFAEAARQHGSRVALIRLNYSTEFRYGVLVDIAQKVQNGDPVDVSTGWVNVIWQRDAVDHILRAFPHASRDPFVLNVTGADILSVRELAETFGRLLERTPVFSGSEEPTAWLNNAAKSHTLFGPPPTRIEEMMEWTAGWVQAGGDTFGKPTGFDKRSGKF